MTILEYVKSKKPMGINDWLKTIKEDGFGKYEKLIINCADNLDKIIINHSAKFENSINI